MNTFYYKLLEAFYKKPRSTAYLKKKFKRIRPDRLTVAIEYLDESFLIDEATRQELEALKNGLPLPEHSSANPEDFTGTYFITENGRQAVEERKEENFRFYFPFVVTSMISLFSLAVSILAIVMAVN